MKSEILAQQGIISAPQNWKSFLQEQVTENDNVIYRGFCFSFLTGQVENAASRASLNADLVSLKLHLTEELAGVNQAALTVRASWASVRPGAVAPEGRPEVQAQPAMQAGLGQAPLGALAAPCHRRRLAQGQIHREHGCSVHLKVLQAADKALLAPCVVGHRILGTSDRHVQEGVRDQSHTVWDGRALQADTCVTRVVPELQLHTAVQLNFSFMPLAIINSQPLQEQRVPNILLLQSRMQNAFKELQEQVLSFMASVKKDGAGQGGSEPEGHAGKLISCYVPPALIVHGQLNEEIPSGSKGKRCWC